MSYSRKYRFYFNKFRENTYFSEKSMYKGILTEAILLNN